MTISWSDLAYYIEYILSTDNMNSWTETVWGKKKTKKPKQKPKPKQTNFLRANIHFPNRRLAPEGKNLISINVSFELTRIFSERCQGTQYLFKMAATNLQAQKKNLWFSIKLLIPFRYSTSVYHEQRLRHPCEGYQFLLYEILLQFSASNVKSSNKLINSQF